MVQFLDEKILFTLTLPHWFYTAAARPLCAYRKFRVGYPFRKIRLNHNKYAILDPDDYEKLKIFNWTTHRRKGSYAATYHPQIKHVTMHRLITNAPPDLVVDHINHNRLDNRKQNLRLATYQQNSWNTSKSKIRKCTSKYKGVAYSKQNRKWYANITVNAKNHYLGSFFFESNAAKAYDRAANFYFGKFACTNFPKKTLPLYKIFILNLFLAVWLRIFTLTTHLPKNKVKPMAKTLYIIDGHAHIYSAYYAPMRQNLTSPAGEPTKAVYIFTNMLLGLIQRVKPDMLIVTMDSKTPSFRADIYPEYKANRKPMPEDMPDQIDKIEHILNAMNIPVIRKNRYEADDLIGTIASKAAKNNIDVSICSKDKDMLQLINKNVNTYDVKTGKRTDPKSMKTDTGLTPQQFLDVLALQGDTADNILGVPDVGPKTALTWIQQYGSIENLYKNADKIKGKRGDNLRASKQIVKLSKKLVTIDRDAPVDFDEKAFSLSEPNRNMLAELFAQLGFNRLITQLGLKIPTPSVTADQQNIKTSKKSTENTTAESTKSQPADLFESSETAAAPIQQPNDITTTKHDYQLIDTPKKFEKFYRQLKKQNIFAFDTETTSISAMKADLVGINFSWQAHKAYYLPVKAPLGQKHLHHAEIYKKLDPIFADQNVKKIGQNLKYDILILKSAGYKIAGIYFDTMVASYCLEPLRSSHSMNNMALDFLNYQPVTISSLIGKGKNQTTFDMIETSAACDYAAEDADVTWRLYEYLSLRLDKKPDLKELFETLEMPLVSVLAEMEFNGVKLDIKILNRISSDIAENLEKLTEKIYAHAGTTFNLDSPKQLAEVLFDRLALPSVKVGKTGRSTDASVLEQLKEFDPIAEMILEYRQLSKLQNTYAEKLGTLINPRSGRVHASFNQTITATGRLSSSDPNLQNIPIRTSLGRKIRSAFVPATKKDCILSADYSQIELRLLAHFSKDPALLEAFENDRDIHSFVASQIYDVPIEQVTSEMRSRCKAVNFGLIYGQGAFGLSRTIGISQAEAKRFIQDYFARYGSIRQFMDDVIASVEATGYAETILHRRRKIPDINSKKTMRRSQARRLAFNTVIQGSAADLIKKAMIDIQQRIEREKLAVKMILQIHDELVFEMPADQAERHAEWIDEAMTGAIKLDVPMKVDIECGRSWLVEKDV